MAENTSPPGTGVGPEPTQPNPHQRSIGYEKLHGAQELLLEYLAEEAPAPTPTGIYVLDKALNGGLHKKGLYVVAGRTGEGKSSLSLSIARRMAIESKAAVLYLSLEMSKQELIERAICQATLIPLKEIEQHRKNGTLLEKIRLFQRALRKAWFHIEDLRGASILELETLWQEMREGEQKPDVLVIDHLQMVNLFNGNGHAMTRADALSGYLADLKRFCKQKNVIILLCCQINRQGAEKPSLIHLKGSGGIEENADAVLIGARQNYDTTKTSEDQNADCEYDLWIAKHRRGAQSKITLTFRPTCFEFLEPSSYGQARHPALETAISDDEEDSIQL